MSGLPQAHKDISSHPGSMGVTAPVDPKAKQNDIERKMQAYGVVQGFREGKYPSNKQIDETLQYTLHHSPVDQKKLSHEGRELIEDVQSIIETARRMVMEKNDDELFQNFLWETRQVDSQKVNPASSAGGTGVGAPVAKDDVKEDANQAAVHLKTLGKLIFTNSEVRKLLKDVGLLARDVAADAAQKTAEKARPDEEELRRADEPAPDNQWVGKDGETRGPNESAPDTGLAEKRDQAINKKDELKEKAQQKANEAQNEAQKHGEETRDRMQSATANAPGDSSSGPSREEREAAQREGRQIKDEKKEQAKNVVSDKFNQAKDKIPQEHKDRARETRDRTKNYLKEKFPEERRDRFIYRLKKVLVEQQRHKDYQEAVDFFLDRAENYHGAAKDVASQSGSHVATVRDDPAYTRAEQNLRTLLERFANNTSMQPIFDSVNQIYEDARNDDDLRSWFHELNTYIRNVVAEPGYVMQDECDREGRRLRENGKGFFNERYRGHREAFTNSVQDFFQAYADDPLNVQLGEDFKRLFKGLALDGDGQLTIKPHLWNDIRTVIVPQLIQRVGYIPIPRIEYTDNMVDLVIENLTLESQNIFPNIIELEVKNYFKLSPYNNIQDKNKHSFWISFAQIQADIRDVPFYFKKKSGFPKISDSGIADVLLAGQGISGEIHLESTGRPGHAFNVVDVKVKVDTLKFKVREAKHSFLISVIRPLATGLVKKTIEAAIAGGIRSGLDQVNAQLSDIKERLDDAAGRDDISRRDVIKDAFARRKEDAEHKAKETDKKTGDLKISADRSSKILAWESKNSIVGVVDNNVQASNHSNKDWRSPKFDIVPDSFQRDDFASRNKNRSLGENTRNTQQTSTLGSNVGSNNGSVAAHNSVVAPVVPVGSQNNGSLSTGQHGYTGQPQDTGIGSVQGDRGMSSNLPIAQNYSTTGSTTGSSVGQGYQTGGQGNFSSTGASGLQSSGLHSGSSQPQTGDTNTGIPAAYQQVNPSTLN